LLVASRSVRGAHTRRRIGRRRRQIRGFAEAAAADPAPCARPDTRPAQRQGVAIQFRFADAMIDIVAGRRPHSDFDGLLREWKTGGGDTIRSELEAAFAAL
jgi:hypothetical protein